MLKKIPLPDILDYYADGSAGKIFSKKGSRFIEKIAFIDKGKIEQRVTLFRTDGSSKHYRVAYLVLGTFEGFRDMKLFEYRFKNGNPKDTTIDNLEWVEKFGFAGALTDVEWQMYAAKLDEIRQEAWRNFNEYIDRRIKKKKIFERGGKARDKFFKRLFAVGMRKVKVIEDAGQINFIGKNDT